MNTEVGGSQTVVAKDAYVTEHPGLLHAWTVHAAV